MTEVYPAIYTPEIGLHFTSRKQDSHCDMLPTVKYITWATLANI